MNALWSPEVFNHIRAIQAADRFEIDADTYAALSAMEPALREMRLELLINAFDYHRRPIIGVYASLAFHGKRVWHEAWQADKARHMQRAWRAYDRAAARLVGEAA